MQTGGRKTSDAEGSPETSPSHLVWTVFGAATVGAWLGMIVSVLGWFDEALVVWFQVSKVATAVGACGGLGVSAVVMAVRMQRRHADQEQNPIAEYDAPTTAAETPPTGIFSEEGHPT